MYSAVHDLNGQKWFFLSVDHGPCALFEAFCDFYLDEPVCEGPGFTRNKAIIKDFFKRVGICGVAVGTSESSLGLEFELLLVTCAIDEKLKLLFFEDYPGSFTNIDYEYEHSLIVESESSRKFHLNNNTNKYCSIIVAEGLRYQQFVGGSNKSNAELSSVLWVGQPESYYCARTLKRLGNDLSERNLHVFIKTHPRDPYHQSSYYTDLLSLLGVTSTVVSNFNKDEILQLGCLFSLTQFSSYSLELMVHGLPAIHVLYPDVGGELLLDIKGYTVPPVCVEGGSILIDNVVDQKTVFDLLINNSCYRGQLVRQGIEYLVPKNQKSSILKDIWG